MSWIRISSSWHGRMRGLLLEEVIRRGRAYLDAGANILYVAAFQSRDEIKQVSSALKDRLRFLSGSFAIKPPLTQKEMKEFGICMATSNLRPCT
jgi:2-methylisocitrate lyase-like PEP mutase family enzyme